MSVKVGLDELRREADVRGPAAFLLTVTDEARPHVVSVVPAWEGGTLVLGAGGSTHRNAAARPDVTILWPAAEPGGYSLIVDGAASTEQEDRVVVTPRRAVLHRPAVDPPPGAHRHDCVDVLPRSAASTPR